MTYYEFDNTDMAGPSSIELRHVSDKQNIQTKLKPHLFLNAQLCVENYIIRTCCHRVFSNFIIIRTIKNTAVLIQ